MPRGKVECNYDCWHCLLPDCQRSTADVAKQPKARRGKRKQAKGTSLAYCYNAKFKPADCTVGLTIKKVDKAELEAMLTAQYGRKLEPITGSKRRQAPKAK
jgi:hypothetical protein